MSIRQEKQNGVPVACSANREGEARRCSSGFGGLLCRAGFVFSTVLIKRAIGLDETESGEATTHCPRRATEV